MKYNTYMPCQKCGEYIIRKSQVHKYCRPCAKLCAREYRQIERDKLKDRASKGIKLIPTEYRLSDVKTDKYIPLVLYTNYSMRNNIRSSFKDIGIEYKSLPIFINGKTKKVMHITLQGLRELIQYRHTKYRENLDNRYRDGRDTIVRLYNYIQGEL